MSRFVLTAQLQLRAPSNTGQVLNQIRSQLSGVTVPVTVTGAQQAQRQLKGVTNQTNQATSAAQRMGGAFGVAVKRFLAFSIAARGISVVTQGLSEATKEAIAFQREMIKISQVTGKAVGDLKGLENTITRLSTGLGVSSKDLLGVSRILAQAGIQAKNLEVALEALAKTTLAPTFDDITKTAEGAVAILAQFQRGVGALEEQLGAINAVAGQFAVESGDLIAAIRRTGGVFKAAGGDLNELLGLFTAIRATTRESAESIATGLRTILTRIQRPSTIKYLEDLGISLVDLNGKFVGPFEAVRRLSGALSGLEEGDLKFVEIAEQLGGFRQIGKVIPLLQQFETAEKARQAAIAGGDSLTKDAASAQAALAVQIVKVKEEFLALIRNIANTTSFQAFVKTALNLASALIKIGEAIKPIIPLLATLGTMAALRGLGGFAKGIGGGLTARNQGGKVYGFARGGVVPGTGNRDTVPAMLQPGEFVIRKSSVEKMGTGTLNAMNQNRFNRGGMMGPSDGRLRSALGSPGKAAVVGTVYTGTKDGATFTNLGALENLDSQVMSQIKASDNKYGGVFLRPEGRGQVVRGNLQAGTIRKEVETSPGYLTALEVAAASGNTPALNALKKEANQIARRASGKEGDHYIYGGSLKKQEAEIMEDNILNGVRSTIDRTSRQIGGQLAMRGTPNQAKIMKTANIDNVVGNIFEAVLIAGGLPYDDGRTLSNAAFDFPGGMGPLAAKFGMTKVKARPTDAKSTFNQGNLKSFDKKVANYEIAQLSREIDAKLQPLAAQMAAAGGATKTGAKSIGLLTAGGKFGTGQSSAAKSLLKRRNSGGSISGKDTVPALLTPGEFVVNKKSAQSIGYGNLASMNSKGVARFNTGGVVGGVQRFANGGLAAGSVSFKGLDTVTSKSTALAIALDKMGASVPNINMVLGKFRTALAGGATNAKALEIALKGTNVQAQSSTAAEAKNTAATEKNTAAQARNSKASGGMMMGMMSLSMVLGMFAPTIDENSSAMDKLKASTIQMAMTLGMVIMALDMFGMKLNARSLFTTTGPGVLGKRAGARVSRGIKSMPGMGGRVGGGLGKATGSLTQAFSKMLGPLALITAAVFAFTKIMDAYTGVHETAKKTIEDGNVAAAGEAAVASANAKAMNNMALAATAGGALIGSAFGPAGAAIGAAVGGLIGLTAKAFATSEAMNELRDGVGFLGQFGDLIGIASSEQIKAIAESQAALNHYTKNLDRNNKEIGNVFQDLQDGAITLDEAMRNAALGANLTNAQDAVERSRKAKGGNEYNFGREVGAYLTFGYMDSNEDIQKGLDKTYKDSIEARNKALEARIANSRKFAKDFVKESGGTKTFDEFLDSQGFSDKEKQAMQEAGGKDLERLRTQFNNLTDETRKQIEAVKALNFGLRDVRATSAVMLQSLSDVDKRAQTGANKFARAAGILELGLTEAAAKLSPEKFADAVDTLGESMIDLGASPEQVTKAKQTLKDLNTVQRGAGKALKNVQKVLEKGGQPKEIEDALKEELLNLLPEGSATREILKKQLEANGKNLSDSAKTALRSGDVDGFLKEVLGNSFGAAGEQIIELAKARAEAETDLIKTIQDRRKSEDDYVKAQQEAINVQIEAAKIIAEFGGAQFTPQQQNLANINKFNLAANQAGVGGLTSGSGADIARVSQGIFRQFQEQERIQQNAFRGDGSGFAGQAGADADNRQRLLSANKELLTFARERIKGYKEELDIVKAKNKAEKSALDKLISGDITGFIQGQIAASAGSALRTGDAGLANLFSAGALGAGFQTLEGQKLDDRTRRRAAGLTLGAVGINDRRSAGVLAGATAEEENIKGLIRETASAMSGIANSFADMKELEVETQNVRIQAKQLVLAEAGNAFSAAVSAPMGTVPTSPAIPTTGNGIVTSSTASTSAASSSSGAAVASNNGRGSVPTMPNFENFSQALKSFNTALAENITRLEQHKFIVKLDPTNVNVNLNGASFLASMKDDIKTELLQVVGEKIKNIKPKEDGGVDVGNAVLG